MIKNDNTALLIIDVQTGLFNKKNKIFEAENILYNINCLLDKFHSAGALVFFVRHTNKNLLQKDSDDWQIHPKLHCMEGDIFINKYQSSVLKEKALISELEKRSIVNLVIAGLVTHGCVKSACIDAKRQGYNVTLAKDCHSSFSKDAEKLIEQWNEALIKYGINVAPAADITIRTS
jgi:nicotinamidase-related amidase